MNSDKEIQTPNTYANTEGGGMASHNGIRLGMSQMDGEDENSDGDRMELFHFFSCPNKP